MDEQPVALAMIARSPNSCDTSLIYGVSPQPAHALENSNSGRTNWLPFMVSVLKSFASVSGILRKNSQFFASVSRSGVCGFMMIASPLPVIGQFWTHTPQPVQSSTATCIVYLRPVNSLPFASTDLNDAGAPARCFGSYALGRMVACGQSREHRWHWMHTAGFHTGTFSAILRFSYWVVAVGQMPSAGICETLMVCPICLRRVPITCLTNSGASSGTGLISSTGLVTLAGYSTLLISLCALSTAALFI